MIIIIHTLVPNQSVEYMLTPSSSSRDHSWFVMINPAICISAGISLMIYYGRKMLVVSLLPRDPGVLSLLTGSIGFAMPPMLQDVPFHTVALVMANSVFTHLVTNPPYLAIIKICHMENKHLQSGLPTFLDYPLKKHLGLAIQEHGDDPV